MAGQANYYTTEIAGLTVYYSYSTPIAFADPETGQIVARVNDWSTTTGGHISRVDGGTKLAKSRRLPSAEFEIALKAAMHRASAPAVTVEHPSK